MNMEHKGLEGPEDVPINSPNIDEGALLIATSAKAQKSLLQVIFNNITGPSIADSVVCATSTNMA
jgi:hypothetical protein